jgi:hypothetical protein
MGEGVTTTGGEQLKWQGLGRCTGCILKLFTGVGGEL